MAITKDDVRHVAGLARLTPTDSELTLYAEQLTKVLAHAEELSTLDTEGVEPTTHAVRIKGPLREDKTLASLTQEEALRNGPATENGCFKVPQIIE